MKVLLVRFGSLGDVVLTLAATAALRAARPEARVTYLVKEEWAPLVAGQAGVDEVWALARGEERATASGLRALRRRIRAAGFSHAVDWQTSPRSRFLLARLPRVVHWRAERWARRRQVSLRWTRPGPLRPAWRRYADALEPLGVRAALVRPPRYAPGLAAEAAAAAFVAAWDAAEGPGGPTVALAPGARWATKRWPAASWAAVAEALRARGTRVLWVGDGADRARFRTALGPGGDAAVAGPGRRWLEGDLPLTAAVLGRARAVVSNDSGLLHLAAAMDRPLVALYASTSPALGFPPAADPGRAVVLHRALSCQPCTLHGRARCPRGHHRCATEIEPAHVLRALDVVDAPLGR